MPITRRATASAKANLRLTELQKLSDHVGVIGVEEAGAEGGARLRDQALVAVVEGCQELVVDLTAIDTRAMVACSATIWDMAEWLDQAGCQVAIATQNRQLFERPPKRGRPQCVTASTVPKALATLLRSPIEP